MDDGKEMRDVQFFFGNVRVIMYVCLAEQWVVSCDGVMARKTGASLSSVWIRTFATHSKQHKWCAHKCAHSHRHTGHSVIGNNPQQQATDPIRLYTHYTLHILYTYTAYRITVLHTLKWTFFRDHKSVTYQNEVPNQISEHSWSILHSQQCKQHRKRITCIQQQWKSQPNIVFIAFTEQT